jgi:hypothetical protein
MQEHELCALDGHRTRDGEFLLPLRSSYIAERTSTNAGSRLQHHQRALPAEIVSRREPTVSLLGKAAHDRVACNLGGAAQDS